MRTRLSHSPLLHHRRPCLLPRLRHYHRFLCKAMHFLGLSFFFSLLSCASHPESVARRFPHSLSVLLQDGHENPVANAHALSIIDTGLFRVASISVLPLSIASSHIPCATADLVRHGDRATVFRGRPRQQAVDTMDGVCLQFGSHTGLRTEVLHRFLFFSCLELVLSDCSVDFLLWFRLLSIERFVDTSCALIMHEPADENFYLKSLALKALNTCMVNSGRRLIAFRLLYPSLHFFNRVSSCTHARYGTSVSNCLCTELFRQCDALFLVVNMGRLLWFHKFGHSFVHRSSDSLLGALLWAIRVCRVMCSVSRVHVAGEFDPILLLRDSISVFSIQTKHSPTKQRQKPGARVEHRLQTASAQQRSRVPRSNVDLPAR